MKPTQNLRSIVRGKGSRPSFLAIAAAVAVSLLAPGVASADHIGPWFVPAGNPADPFSFTNLTITLTGNPIGTTGNLVVTGSGDITTNIDLNGVGGPYGGMWNAGPGNGTFNFNDTHLAIESIFNVLIDTGGLGTILVDLVDVGIQIQTSDVTVTGNEWEVGFGAEEPTTFDVSLNTGSIVLHDGTGLLAGVDETLDLAASPIGIGIAELVAGEFTINGTADNISVSNIIPLIAIDIDPNGEILAPGLIFAELESQVFLQVPEPSSLAMLGLGLVGLVAVGRGVRRPA